MHTKFKKAASGHCHDGHHCPHFRLNRLLRGKRCRRRCGHTRRRRRALPGSDPVDYALRGQGRPRVLAPAFPRKIERQQRREILAQTAQERAQQKALEQAQWAERRRQAGELTSEAMNLAKRKLDQWNKSSLVENLIACKWQNTFHDYTELTHFRPIHQAQGCRV